MNSMEAVRDELYKAIEFGDNTYILKISKKLDAIIVKHMKANSSENALKNPA